MRHPFAITLDVASSLANKTGGWRVERPVFVDRLPPCNDACPSGEDVQGWLYAAESGDYKGAWRRLVRDNPMPATTGRVCFRPCETACNRVQVDEAVGIRSVERFLGDHAIGEGWSFPGRMSTASGNVLVVGSGPCGLSAAYHLRRAGHRVTIYETSASLGGMLRYGIPAYRLPRSVLNAEVRRIVDMGVTVETRHRVDDVLAAREDGRFDAVLLALGAPLAHHVPIPAVDSAYVLDALSYLHGAASGHPPQLGRCVAVYGGGDTALDAARTALRLGAEEAVVVYRRTGSQMPANSEEYEQALAEGVQMHWLSTVARAGDGELLVERMELDDTGFPQPTGVFETLEANALVLALGEETDLSSVDRAIDIHSSDGVIDIGPTMMTGHPGIFAGGDVVAGERSVTAAIGNGKKVARQIGAWLSGENVSAGSRHPLAELSSLNTWYYADAPRTVQAELERARRLTTFDEVVAGLNETDALFEARRCMSCGSCLECANCFGMCPDNAVHRVLDPLAKGPLAGGDGVLRAGGVRPFAFDYDYCKGCGICVSECPSGAIVMEPEVI